MACSANCHRTVGRPPQRPQTESFSSHGFPILSLLSACLGSLADESGKQRPCVEPSGGPCPQPPMMLNPHLLMTNKAGLAYAKYVVSSWYVPRYHDDRLAIDSRMSVTVRSSTHQSGSLVCASSSSTCILEALSKPPPPTDRPSRKKAPLPVNFSHIFSLTSASRQRRI
jgi:hypothetical protein